MEIDFILSPDYSSTLDNPNWKEYHRIPPGGTDVQSIQDTANAKGSIEFGYAFHKTIKRQSSIATAGEILESTFSVPKIQQKLPIGIRLTDLLFDNLKKLTGKDIPNRYKDERGRLVDAYVDAHKTLFGVKAVVYGEEDFVISMVSFLEEIGVHTVLATSGGNSGLLKQGVEEVVCNKHHQITVKHDCDFEQVNELVDELKPDMLIGNSKGYYISRRLNIPLIRVGFPIHDRVGAQRVQHLAYSGTQQLLDRITNAIIAHKQDASPIGYKYM
jgi:nitrogenase molybdenum-iron protein NifN